MREGLTEEKLFWMLLVVYEKGCTVTIDIGLIARIFLS